MEARCSRIGWGREEFSVFLKNACIRIVCIDIGGLGSGLRVIQKNGKFFAAPISIHTILMHAFFLSFPVAFLFAVVLVMANTLEPIEHHRIEFPFQGFI